MIYSTLEEKIYYFHEKNEKQRYRNRLECSKEYGHSVYWAFWGEVQARLLDTLPPERITKKAQELLAVLKRKFNGNYVFHKNTQNYTGGSVHSPISGKENIISDNQWRRILENQKITNRRLRNSKWTEVKGGFIESSIEEFAMSFRTAIENDPKRFLNLMLEITDIHEEFIDEFFSALAYNKKLCNLCIEDLEKVIFKFKYNYDSYRAGSICRIIENCKTSSWSREIINIISDIAVNHTNPSEGQVIVSNKDDSEMRTFDMLINNAINCVRGEAASAIASLLWSDYNLLEFFKDTVFALTNDVNEAVKLASLECLISIYNIEKVWASDSIIRLFKDDFRIVGHPDSKQMLLILYPDYMEEIIEVTLKCFYSDDEHLIKVGSYAISEMFFVKNEFVSIINNLDNLTEIQVKAIIEMSIVYLDISKYREESKKLILSSLNTSFDLEFPLVRVFYDNKVDLMRDYEFINSILKSKQSRRILHSFSNYLEENALSVVDYNEIIIMLCHELLSTEIKGKEWGIDDELSKLIAGLYDEVSEGEHKNYELEQKCLDIWDLMYEKRVGMARILTKQIQDR